MREIRMIGFIGLDSCWAYGRFGLEYSPYSHCLSKDIFDRLFCSRATAKPGVCPTPNSQRPWPKIGLWEVSFGRYLIPVHQRSNRVLFPSVHGSWRLAR